MVSSRFVAGAALLLAGTCCFAQKPVLQVPETAQSAGGTPGTTTLSLDARLVNLPVIVRDKKGAILNSFTKDDFTLTVDGHAETIRYFDKDSNLPLTVGLLVDVSGSVRNTLDEERTASAAFLEQMLKAPEGRAPDRAFVIQFGHETELLADVTYSKPKLQAAIKELGSTNPNKKNDEDPDPPQDSNSGRGRHGGGAGGGTTLYDAAFLAADEVLSKQKGRKAIVLLTDGEDRGSKESLNRAIEAAQRADTVVYAIYFKGSQPHDDHQNDNGGQGGGGRHGGGFPGGGGGGGYPGGGGQRGGGGGRPQETQVDGKKILEKMTGETGGRMFEMKGKQDFNAIYTQIAEELRSQYRLGFTPDKEILDDGYHRVDLDLPKTKNLRIQTRDGYYTGKS